MNILIQSTIKTLQKTQGLLEQLSNNQLCNTSVPPYHSSIGTHVRHILDFYDCIFKINDNYQVDLTARSRNTDIESDCNCAQDYLNKIIEQLNSTSLNIADTIFVTDDLGLGKTEIPYTFGALLAQANSHTIHHYAIINYIFDNLGIVIEDSDFGYNPTTPKPAALN